MYRGLPITATARVTDIWRNLDGIITVMTNNGQLDLQDHNFRLLYSRRENDRVVARIVARKEGVIEAKVEPDADGKDQPEAFRALRKHVEVKLEHILQNVPGEGSATQGVADSRGMPADAPPAYGTGDPVKGLVK